MTTARTQLVLKKRHEEYPVETERQETSRLSLLPPRHPVREYHLRRQDISYPREKDDNRLLIQSDSKPVDFWRKKRKLWRRYFRTTTISDVLINEVLRSHASPTDVRRKPRQPHLLHNWRPPHRTKRITLYPITEVQSKIYLKIWDFRNSPTKCSLPQPLTSSPTTENSSFSTATKDSTCEEENNVIRILSHAGITATKRPVVSTLSSSSLKGRL